MLSKAVCKACILYLNYSQTCLEGMILNTLFHLNKGESNNFGIWMATLSLRKNNFIYDSKLKKKYLPAHVKQGREQGLQILSDLSSQKPSGQTERQLFSLRK